MGEAEKEEVLFCRGRVDIVGSLLAVSTLVGVETCSSWVSLEVKSRASTVVMWWFVIGNVVLETTMSAVDGCCIVVLLFATRLQ